MNPENAQQERFAVVIPVYNEAAVIAGVVESFCDKVVRKVPNAELIVAEDGSTDGTKEVLARLNERIPFRLISSPGRKGYTGAFKDALRAANADWIFFSDSDGQHDPADALVLWAGREGADIVSGWKRDRRDPLYRVAISRAFNALVFVLFGLKIRDVNSGFKLIRRKVVDDILASLTFEHCIMAEFVIRAARSGYRIREIPVRHFARKKGGSNVFTPGHLPGVIGRLCVDLWRLRCAAGRDRKEPKN